MNKKLTIKEVKEIEELRKQNKTLNFIAQKFSVTVETIRRQLNYNYCDKHKNRYSNRCYFCNKEIIELEYNKKINKLSKSGLLAEIRKLSKPNREEELVIKRIKIIKKLHNELNFNFSQIAKLMRRHHSSIINLYYKK